MDKYVRKYRKVLCLCLLVCLVSSVFGGCGISDAGSGDNGSLSETASGYDSDMGNDSTEVASGNENDTNEQVSDESSSTGGEQKINGGQTVSTDDKFESASCAVASMKVGWNLGNTLDSTGDWISRDSATIVTNFETAWGNPVVTEKLIRHIKDLGFGAVRIPVTWNYHFDNEGNIDEKWMKRVTELVDCVIDNGMYCIINVHHDTGESGWLRASTSNFTSNHIKFEKIWTQIATNFRDYDEKLLFEGFNELLDESANWSKPGSDALSAVNMYNQSFVACVRGTGGNNSYRNLLVNTYAASSDDDVLSGFKLPFDTAKDHLIVEVHSYEPWSFTSTTATWTTMTNTFGEKEKMEVDTKLELMDQYFVSKDIPLIIGEFGSEDKSNTAEREKWASYVVSEAKKHGITCFVWDNGGKFNMGLVDRNVMTDSFPTIIKAIIDAAK
ncbi:MAG: glycoside hydrolase family 5 protein [Lachnospira sp.]